MQRQNPQPNGIPLHGGMPPMRNPMQGDLPNGVNQILARAIQSHPQPQSGWQATADKKQRFVRLHQIFTVISMSTGSPNTYSQDNLLKMVNVASQMERELFNNAPNSEAYAQGVNERLLQIKTVSQRGGQNPQNVQGSQSMQPPPLMQQQNMGMMQQNFNNVSRPSIPGGLSNGMPQRSMGPQASMMANQSSGQNVMNPGITPQMQQQGNHQPQQLGMGAHLQNVPPLTKEDNINIAAMVGHIFERAQQNGQLGILKARASQMPEAMKAKLQKAGINPIEYQIRSMAEKDYQTRKAQAAQGQDPSSQQKPASNAAFRMQGSNQSSNANALGQNSLKFDPTDFAGQQAEALRSQAVGDLVVPASNNQSFTTQQFPYGTQGGGSQNQGAGNRRQAQAANVQGMQLANQPTAQSQARVQAQARMGQANQTPQPQRVSNQDRLQGQVGGLHSFDNPGPQPSPMRTLNQPLAQPAGQGGRNFQPGHTQLVQGAQGGNFQGNNKVRPSSQAPQGNQQQTNGGSSNPPPFLPQMPPAFQNMYHQLPAEMRSKLNALPPQRFQDALLHIQGTHPQRPFQNQQNNASQVPQAGSGPPRIPGVAAQMANAGMVAGRPDANRTINAPQPNMPPSSDQPNMPGQTDLTFMDSMPLPRDTLAQMWPTLTSKLPPHVSTWASFKDLFRNDPSILPSDQQKAMLAVQKAQYVAIRKRMMVQAAGQNHAAQASTYQAVTQDNASMYRSRLGDLRQREAVLNGAVQILPNGMPQMAPISDDEVRNFRMQFGQRAQHQPDENLRRAILANKFQTINTKDPDLAMVLRPQLAAQIAASQPSLPATAASSTNLASAIQNQGLAAMPPRDTSNLAGTAGQGRGRGQNGVANRGGVNEQSFMKKASQSTMPPGPPKGVPQAVMGQNRPVAGQEQMNRLAADQQTREAARQQALMPQQANQQQPSHGQQGLAPGSNGTQSNVQMNEEYQKIRRAAMVATQRDPVQYRRIGREEQENFVHLSQLFEPVRKILDHAARFFFAKRVGMDRQVAMKTVFEMIQHCLKLLQQKINQSAVCISIEEYRFRLNVLQNFVKAMSQQTSATIQPNVVPQTKGQERSSIATSDRDNRAVPAERSTSARAKSEDQPPAAPTSEKPPVSFLTASPHRTPHYAPSMQQFDPNKMAVPQQRKRRRQESMDTAHVTSDRPQEKTTPAATAMRRDTSTNQQRRPAPVKNFPFKCPVPQCEFEKVGFESREQAETHSKETHGYQGDALDWCLGVFREVLNLDKQGRSLKKAQGMNSEGGDLTEDRNVPALENEGLRLKAESSMAANRSTVAGRSGQKHGNNAARLDPSKEGDAGEAWKHSAIARESMHFVFSGLKDFPPANRGLARFADARAPLHDWPAEKTGSTVRELADEMQKEQGNKSISPSSVVRVELDEWDPFAGLDGGRDRYEGMVVEVVRNAKEGPFVATEYEDAIMMLETPEWQEQFSNGEEGKENVDFGDWAIDWDKVEFDEKGVLEKDEGSPPKKVKTTT